MSMTSQVIKNKNRREKEAKTKRAQEISDMKVESAYRSKLYAEMQRIDLLFDDPDVEGVTVTVPQKYLSHFLKAIYSEEMSEYTVIQKDATVFRISRKVVNF